MSNIQGIAIALNSLEERVDSHIRFLMKMKFNEDTEDEIDGISEGEVRLIENLIIDASKEITGTEPQENIWEESHNYCSKNLQSKKDWTSEQIEYFKWLKHWFSLSRTYIKYLSGFQKEVLIESVGYKIDEKFSNSDKLAVNKSLDSLFEQLQELKLGQELIYNDLSEDIESLKQLMEFLSKKDWFQLLKGKLLDAGLGTLSGEAFQIVLKAFSNQGLLE
jgi:hypothetical protein